MVQQWVKAFIITNKGVPTTTVNHNVRKGVSSGGICFVVQDAANFFSFSFSGFLSSIKFFLRRRVRIAIKKTFFSFSF